MDLEGKVAIVTGGGRGIGAAICQELAQRGATLAINDLADTGDVRETVEMAAAFGHPVQFLAGDVTIVSDVNALVAETIDTFGRIDILVNNAGRALHAAPEEIDEPTWDWVLDLHLKAPFFAAQAAARHMQSQGHGRVINIASEQAFTGHPMLAHYSAAKAGLITLTRSLATAWAPTILVNAVCPGPTASKKFQEGPEYTDEVRDTVKIGRFVTPRDIALTVGFLAGEGGSVYTGQHLDPNGGAVMP